jgi:hypothetical protein
MRAKVENSDRGRKLIVSEVQPFDGEAFRRPPERLIIETDEGALVNGRHERLKVILSRYPGRDVVEMHLKRTDGSTMVCALEQRIDRDAPGLHGELMEVFGGGSVRDV